MSIPARLLATKIRRRVLPFPPSLFHLYTHFSSSPSNSLFSSSSHNRHHGYQNLYFRNPQLLFSCSFSAQRDLSDSGEPILPVRALISVLDTYHDFTGFPWWIVISSSTLIMRLSLFPLVVLQLKKLKRIGELLPKLPPPLPPPLSGQRFRDQITLFWKEKQATGCPSFFWFFSSVAVQVPCFFLWIMSIRRMSLEHHSGFDCGGTLWFQNLTEYPHGGLGPIFPLMIAGLHFANVQISFQKSSLQRLPGIVGTLAKYYKIYLQLLTMPIMFITFNVPQGSLVYWLTNSSLTLIQQLCLGHPNIREKLGLPVKEASAVATSNKEMEKIGVAETDIISTKGGKISVQNLSPEELVALSVKVLTDGHKDRAIPLLRLAFEKDPGYVRALLLMGQILLQKEEHAEATEFLESSISKLLAAGHPTEVEDVDLLILSSQWAGVACIRQGKIEEGLLHLERIAQLKEPEDTKSRAHYYDGLLLLSSALTNMGRKAEALKHLRKASAYDSSYDKYLKDAENDDDDFVSDLANTRRGDL
ncbi:ALBINO3-like protein 2, chloroplastic isoform X1 [Olea europaea var. sylvestris]|uniref:ALBINO3-like protein 2, chloroplastic isoform X1 n=2 Tax=Olea europaea var. sylvestris TaxID=158386 RepID=UPI000C1CF9F0|nr:ALBINO3-like protein 2, chloroplastic isoform X1 [Olea europaea var. sylvestris]